MPTTTTKGRIGAAIPHILEVCPVGTSDVVWSVTRNTFLTGMFLVGCGIAFIIAGWCTDNLEIRGAGEGAVWLGGGIGLGTLLDYIYILDALKRARENDRESQ